MPRILIADVCPTRRAAAQRCFAAGGYQVETTATAADCLVRLGAFQPEVLILEQNLPEVGTQLVLHWLRTAGPPQPIPAVILLSDSAAETITRIMLTTPAVETLFPQPVRVADLAQAIRTAVSEAEWPLTPSRCQREGAAAEEPPPWLREAGVEVPLLVPGRQYTSLKRTAQHQGLTLGQLLYRVIAAHLAEVAAHGEERRALRS